MPLRKLAESLDPSIFDSEPEVGGVEAYRTATAGRFVRFRTLFLLHLSDAYSNAVRIRRIIMVEHVRGARRYNRVGFARIYWSRWIRFR